MADQADKHLRLINFYVSCLLSDGMGGNGIFHTVQ